MLFGPSSMPLWVFGAWLRRERPTGLCRNRWQHGASEPRDSHGRPDREHRRFERWRPIRTWPSASESRLEGIFLEGGQLPTQSPQAWSVTQRRHSVAKHLESGGHSSTVGKALTFKLLTN